MVIYSDEGDPVIVGGRDEWSKEPIVGRDCETTGGAEKEIVGGACVEVIVLVENCGDGVSVSCAVTVWSTTSSYEALLVSWQETR